MTHRTPSRPARYRSGRQRRHRRIPVLAGAALAAAALTAAAPAAQAVPSHPAARAITATRATSAPANQIPALAGTGTATVTLITGDKVTLTPGAPGRDAVTTVPDARPGGADITFHASGKPGHQAIYAIPGDAAGEIYAGRLDKNLFSLGYLTSAGDTGQAASIPVVLRYAGHLSAAGLAGRAARLPGATVTATDPAAGTATVHVSTAKAAAFWSALTGGQPLRPVPPARPGGEITFPPLADGVSQAWLAGHPPAAANPAPQDPGYTVTETVYGPPNPGTDPGAWCSPNPGLTICPFFADYLFGVAGSGADTLFPPIGYFCLDTNPCDQVQVKYQVPAGEYSLGAGFWDYESNNHLLTGLIGDPQVTVAGNTSLTVKIADARPATVATPRPSTLDEAVLEETRTTPDGTSIADGFFPGYQTGDGTWTATVTPAPGPVSVGTSNLSLTWQGIQPPVQVAVTAPRHLALNAYYPGDSVNTHAFPWPYGVVARFAGTHTYQVVDAGDGTSYQGLNLKGKLALIDLAVPNPEGPYNPCFPGVSVLRGALNAGAAGVIIDAYSPAGTLNGNKVPDFYCPLPIQPLWWYDFGTGLHERPVPIPFVSIPHSQAQALRSMLTQGPVGITVTAGAVPSPYQYELKFLEQGRFVPAAMRQTVTPRDLATITANYHASPGIPAGALAFADYGGWATNEYTIGLNTSYFLPQAATRTEYVNASPDEIGYRDLYRAGLSKANGQFHSAFNQAHPYEYRMFIQPGQQLTEDWLERPPVPGLAAPPTDVFAAQPGRFDDPFDDPFLQEIYAECAYCRQGNTFYPIAQAADSAAPRHAAVLIFEQNPADIQLYANGKQIPPEMIAGFFVGFQMPPQRARYKLVVHDGVTHDTWDFTSAEPTADTRPEGTQCAGDVLNNPGPCAAPPLILVSYDAGLSLDNTVTAPGVHRLQITAYEEAANAPRITSLTAWTSTDGGKTWQQAKVLPGHQDGSYTAQYTVPPLASTSGTVSLKVQARDAAGNNITQVIPNAYGLAAAPR